ncbi:TDP-4-keto-6-deoxy-D-glucose transaminase [Hyaloraphidium curvatum]|nr:TDP-4-keto-6-deoxy-D-glucose transaminase [Hyaloraphidium curvatum]
MEPLSRGDTGPVPFCRQHIVGQEATYVAQVLSTGLDSASRFTNMCASRVQSLLGPESSRVLITPSCTAALEMAALLCDLQPGDEVIMPSFTFSSTANAFVLRGAVPVFVDVRADTLNIDEALIDAAVTAKTRAICCVHYAGVPCEMDAICSIARRHGLLVVEDAAQGFLSTYKGRQLGSIGDFGCISFHYTKNVICGEGGALSINRSSERARRALLVWEKGTNRYDFLMGKIDKYEWVDVGSSHVPNEVSCAILNAQLERCEEITAKRVANHARYLEGFKDLIAQGVFRVPHVPPGCTINGHIFFLVFPSTDVKEQFAAGLKAAGITAFSHYSPLHSSVAGLKYGRASGRMEITSSVHARLLRLPMWPGLSSVEAASIIDMVHKLSARFVQSRTS